MNISVHSCHFRDGRKVRCSGNELVGDLEKAGFPCVTLDAHKNGSLYRKFAHKICCRVRKFAHKICWVVVRGHGFVV